MSQLILQLEIKVIRDPIRRCVFAPNNLEIETRCQYLIWILTWYIDLSQFGCSSVKRFVYLSMCVLSLIIVARLQPSKTSVCVSLCRLSRCRRVRTANTEHKVTYSEPIHDGYRDIKVKFVYVCRVEMSRSFLLFYAYRVLFSHFIQLKFNLTTWIEFVGKIPIK